MKPGNQSMIRLAWLYLVCCIGHSGLFASEAQREHFTLKSEDGKVTYVVDAWLPKGYLANPRPFPLLLMLDGEYAFSSAVQLSDYLQRNGEIKEFIIVGVSYGVGFGKPLAVERTRDFTPPMDDQRTIKKSETAYYRFIKDRLLPELRARYQIDPRQRTLWTYSLSGSFAMWLNYFDPTLFDHYIIAGGNADFGILPKIFQRQIFQGPEYSGRRVFFAYDTSEIPDPKLREDAIKLLASKDAFPGYEMKLMIMSEESHASSWFVSLPTALRFVFGFGGGAGASKSPAANAPANAASSAQP
jgi:predicted alpha/beta superfamily hydrolase